MYEIFNIMSVSFIARQDLNRWVLYPKHKIYPRVGRFLLLTVATIHDLERVQTSLSRQSPQEDDRYWVLVNCLPMNFMYLQELVCVCEKRERDTYRVRDEIRI